MAGDFPTIPQTLGKSQAPEWSIAPDLAATASPDLTDDLQLSERLIRNKQLQYIKLEAKPRPSEDTEPDASTYQCRKPEKEIFKRPFPSCGPPGMGEPSSAISLNTSTFQVEAGASGFQV
jgi:hypothetical protein